MRYGEVARIFTVCLRANYHILGSNGALAIFITPRAKQAFHTVQYYLILDSNVPQQ
jgi:hypothetical protein